MKSIPSITLAALCMIIISSCQETDPEPKDINDPEKEQEPSPKTLAQEISSPFDLGRAIFYDENLSADNTIACASCHKQEFAFADNKAFSEGINGKLSSRNSMPIQNINTEFSIIFDSVTQQMDTLPPTPLFWDGRELDLLTMVLIPFTHEDEHGFSQASDLVRKANQYPYYTDAAKKLYGSQELAEYQIAESLAQFVQSIRTEKTRFSEFLISETGLTDLEITGKDLFFEKYDCNACHQVQSSSGYLTANNDSIDNPTPGFSNIGLPYLTDDKGLYQTTNNQSDIGKFKIPSLRNVAHTAPYMHDGRFQSLDDVIEHYSVDIEDDPNLDTLLKDDKGVPIVFNITAEEKEAIIAFLGTLSDERVLHAVEFSNPFEQAE